MTTTFCAGADLKALAAGESLSPGRDPNRGVGVLFRHLVDKPVVAAVNGGALGGGTELAPLSVRANRRLAYDGMAYGSTTDPGLWAWHDGVVRKVVRSRDGREGPRAFAEKREPVWTGS